MQKGNTGADSVTKFISITIAVMQTTVRMTELQVTRVAFASNDLPTELVVRQYVTYKYNAGKLLTHTALQRLVNKQCPFIVFPSSSIFCSLLLSPFVHLLLPYFILFMLYNYFLISIYLSIYLSISYLSLIYLSIFPWLCSPLLGIGCFFSFLIFYTVCRAPWTGDQPVTRPLPAHRTAQTQNKRSQTSMPQVGFKPIFPVFERAKTVHALDRAATVIGFFRSTIIQLSSILYYLYAESTAARPITDTAQCRYR
jgi:hypothetical protein